MRSLKSNTLLGISLMGFTFAAILGTMSTNQKRKRHAVQDSVIADLESQRDSLRLELQWFKQYIAPNIDSIQAKTQDSAVTRAIVSNALRFGVPPRLLAAVAQTESDFTLGAEGGAGERGMLQVIPAYWYRTAVRHCGAWRHGNLWEEICAGAVVLQYYYSTCDSSWYCALHKYNTGKENTIAGERYASNVGENL